MPKEDKVKLDAATNLPTPNTLIKRDSSGRARVAAPSDPSDIARKQEVDSLIITTEKLAPNAVTSPTIANEAIEARHISGGLTLIGDALGINAKFNLLDEQLAESARHTGGIINVLNCGAIGDGGFHPLSEFFPTLVTAQMKYPHVTSLTQETDWAAITLALITASSSAMKCYAPKNLYRLGVDTLVIPANLEFYGDGGITNLTKLHYSGIGHAVEMAGLDTRYNTLSGIAITGGNTGATAIYCYRPYIRMKDINIYNFIGSAINLDGNTSETWGCWQTSIEDIRIVGKIDELGNLLMTKGIILGANANNVDISRFTIHNCDNSGIEINEGGQIWINDGNISECYQSAKSIYAIRIHGGTVIHLSDLYIENNINGILIDGGQSITIDNILCNGIDRQLSFLRINGDFSPNNIYVKNCFSKRHTGYDIRITGGNGLKLENNMLLSTVPILNSSSATITIVDGANVYNQTDGSSPKTSDASLGNIKTLTASASLGYHDSNKYIIVNPPNPFTATITLPTYKQGTVYTLLTTTVGVTLTISSTAFENFNSDVGVVTQSIKLAGLGSIQVLSLGDRWVVLSQKGNWTLV